MDDAGQHGAGGGGPEALVDVGVEARDEVLDATGAGLERVQDLVDPLLAVFGVGVDEGRHLADGRAVGGPECGEASGADAVEARQVVGHVAVGRGDDRGRPAHDVVAGEAGVLFLQGVAEMVGGVAGGRDGFHGPAGTRDLAAAAEAHVGTEVVVVAGLHLHLAGVLGLVAGDRAAVDGRPGRGLQRAGERGVVGVVVGDQDVGDALARHGLEDGVEVRRVVGARVNHRDLAAADDVGPRALEGEGPGVVGHHPADQRRDLVAGAVFELEVPDVGDHPPSTPERS